MVQLAATIREQMSALNTKQRRTLGGVIAVRLGEHWCPTKHNQRNPRDVKSAREGTSFAICQVARCWCDRFARS